MTGVRALASTSLRVTPSIGHARRRRVLLGAVLALTVSIAASCGDSSGTSTIDFDAPGQAATDGTTSSLADSEPRIDPSTTSLAASTAVGKAEVKFETLPPGSELPDEDTCAAQVPREGREVRPDNAVFNQTRGHPTPADADPNNPRFARVTGNFVGTTEEIIRWAACKWGIDEDVVRAQAAKETYWFQKNVGDFSSDPSRCVPGHAIGADGRPGECPESVGIMQIRYPYFETTIADAVTSTAYNLDLAYAVWRACFEGEESWLNTVERGQDYVAGDLWGCVGRWLAGRWYTTPAKAYIGAVQDYVEQRIWETAGFKDYTE